MRIIHKPDKQVAKVALTIGNFDGFHLGHAALCKEMRSLNKETLLLTFSNHSSQILTHSVPKNLTTLATKLRLIEKCGIDTALVIPFTEQISEMSAEEFLSSFMRQCPFSDLILGYDAKLGKGRYGDRKTIEALSKKLGFSVTYIEPKLYENEPISSSRIRKSLEKGDLKSVEAMLGRPYALEGCVAQGEAKGRLIGFKTANIALDGLFVPLLGVYAVSISHKGLTYRGVANLGVAPTVRPLAAPLLEVHILDLARDLYGETLEVTFLQYLREERRFPTLEALQNQIAQDVAFIKS